MSARVTAVRPAWAIEGGRITIEGTGFPVDRPSLPDVRSAARARASCTRRPTAISVLVPSGLEGGQAAGPRRRRAGETACRRHRRAVRDGPAPGRQPGLRSRTAISTSPTAARAGSRCRCPSSGCGPTARARPFSSGIVNPTSMAIDPEGRLYVSSRFEGTVYRVRADGTVEPFATDLGVACGLAFAPDGTLFVGDRSGTIFRVDRARARRRRSRRCRRAWRRFTSPSAPTARSTSRRRRSRRTTIGVSHRARRHGDDGYAGVRPAAGARVRSAGARCSSSRRWRARAACIASAAAGAPELLLSGPGLVGVAVRPAGGLVVSLERDRLPPARPAFSARSIRP